MPSISNNALSNTQVKTIAFSKMVGTSVFAEANDLLKQGLIGEDSTIGGSFSESGHSSVIHWSKKDYQQWLAFKNEASPEALQAAEYQQQMRQQRIDLANDYLTKVFDLAAKFSKLDNVEIGFFSYLDFRQGEKEAPKMSDLERQQVEKFWQQNSSEITALNQAFESLKAHPKDLESWMESRDFAIDDKVFAIVDKMANAWTSTRSDQKLEADYSPVSVVFESEQLTNQAAPSKVSPQITNGASFYSHLDSLNLEFGQQDYQTWGKSHILFKEVAAEHQKEQQQATYQEMQTLVKGLFEAFAKQFGAAQGFPRFSLQDMVENYNAQRPLATLSNGQQHPMASDIEKFWHDNQQNLHLYSLKQQQLDSTIELNRYMKIYAQQIQRYMQENIDYFLNKPLPQQYNV